MLFGFTVEFRINYRVCFRLVTVILFLECVTGGAASTNARQGEVRDFSIKPDFTQQGQSPMRHYADLQEDVPILAAFFSGADLKPAFRLSRESINTLIQMLPREKAHGWSHEVEVLVTTYWLACGASYRMTADVFAMPLSTVCRIAHNVVDDMITVIHRVIHFPKREEMEAVGAGFEHLAGHETFRRAAGAIDGCHIKIVPPAEPHKKSYINRKLGMG